MVRINKNTRTKGLPPKLLLSQLNEKTGSTPTKVRIVSDNRTGKYSVFFDDTKTINFVSTSNVSMPSVLPVGSFYLNSENTSSLTQQGTITKGISNNNINIPIPGQELQPFKDNELPEVDELSRNNQFYATGTSISDVGEGFTQPLWAKTKFEIDLTPSSAHSFFLQSNLGTDRNFPMAYWNKNTKKYEGIGLGKEFRNYVSGANKQGLLTNLLDQQCIGFNWGTDNGGTNVNRDLAIGAVVSNYGFPYHPKFHATSSNLIQISDYINEPFLLEKIVLIFSGTFAYNNTANRVSTRMSLCTFFVLNQRSPFDTTSYFETISWTSASNLQQLLTSSVLPTVHSGTYINTSRDLITWCSVMGTSSFLSSEAKKDKELLINGTEWTGKYTVSGTVKSPCSSNGMIEELWSYDNNFFYFLVKNESSSRNGLFIPTGRDLVGGLESGQIISTETVISGLPLVLLNKYSKPNPYLLLPGDNLVFGWQLPIAQSLNGNGSDTDQYPGIGSELSFSTAPSKIIFYGSTLSKAMETHDTLNQLLTSQVVYEDI